MSDPRDDEPIGIDADAPEADWIEQHQQVMDEYDDDDLFPVEIPDGIPEADALDQARSVPDDDFTFADDPAPVEISSEFDDERAPDDDVDQPELPHETTPGRGCNPIGVLADALAALRESYQSWSV